MIYQQWDSMEGAAHHGLATLLSTYIGLYPRQFNCDPLHSKCLANRVAARFIREHKEDKPGYFYIRPNTVDQKEEYNYYVTFCNGCEDCRKHGIGSVHIQVNDSEKMSIKEFVKMCGVHLLRGMWLPIF